MQSLFPCWDALATRCGLPQDTTLRAHRRRPLPPCCGITSTSSGDASQGTCAGSADHAALMLQVMAAEASGSRTAGPTESAQTAFSALQVVADAATAVPGSGDMTPGAAGNPGSRAGATCRPWQWLQLPASWTSCSPRQLKREASEFHGCGSWHAPNICWPARVPAPLLSHRHAPTQARLLPCSLQPCLAPALTPSAPEQHFLTVLCCAAKRGASRRRCSAGSVETGPPRKPSSNPHANSMALEGHHSAGAHSQCGLHTVLPAGGPRGATRSTTMPRRPAT